MGLRLVREVTLRSAGLEVPEDETTAAANDLTTVVGVDDRRVPLFETGPDAVLGSGEDL